MTTRLNPDLAADPVPPAEPEGQPWIVGVFLLVPMASLLAIVPAVLLGWVSWLDLGLAFVLYLLTAFGITVGYHRLFTHGSFKARRPLRLTLAVLGSLALEGTVADWVADHRKHHKYSDLPGDPHSPGATERATGRWPRDWCSPTSAGCCAAIPRTWRATPPTSCATATWPGCLATSRGSCSPPCCCPLSWGTPHLVVAGRADRLLLGRSGADHVRAPGDVGDQLRLSRVGPTAIPDP